MRSREGGRGGSSPIRRFRGDVVPLEEGERRGERNKAEAFESSGGGPPFEENCCTAGEEQRDSSGVAFKRVVSPQAKRAMVNVHRAWKSLEKLN